MWLCLRANEIAVVEEDASTECIMRTETDKWAFPGVCLWLRANEIVVVEEDARLRVHYEERNTSVGVSWSVSVAVRK